MDDFEALPLQDALINSIEANWKKHSVKIKLEAFSERNRNAKPHTLVFDNVTSTNMPHQSPWGESHQINKASTINGTYEIEMQSDDTIRISATGFRFEQSASYQSHAAGRIAALRFAMRR